MGWGGFGICWCEDIPVPAAYQVAAGSDGASLFQDPFAEYNFVLEGHVYRHSQSIAWPWPWGSQGPWGFGGNTNYGDSILRYAYRGMTTGATDNPSHLYIPGALTVPVNFEISIPHSGSLGRATSALGAIEFAPFNDDDLGYWSGRQFTLKVGGIFNKGLSSEVDMEFKNYIQRYRFIAEDIEYDEQIARVLVRDGLKALNNPIQQSTFSGSGTYGGTAALIKQYRPLTFGKAFNIPCVLIDDTNYIYQVNDGTLDDITDVRINGKSFTDSGDTTDLPSWGGGAGQYKTDKSRGLFRIGEQPDGQVTADAQRSTTQGGLVLLELIDYMGITEVDRGSFETVFKEDIGFYVGTVAQDALSVISRIVSSADAYIYASRAGLITLGGHENPREAVPAQDLRGHLEADLFTYEEITNYIGNNSDILDSSWTVFNTPTITTGITDPLGGSNAFNIEDDQAAWEAKIYDNIQFAFDGPKVVTCFVRKVSAPNAVVSLRHSSGGWRPQIHVAFGATPADQPTLTLVSGTGTLYDAAPAIDNWWFIQYVTMELVGGDTYALWLAPNTDAFFPKSTDFAYPCVYENKNAPNYPATIPFTDFERSTVITTGAIAAGEGNVVDERIAFAFPAYIKSIKRMPTPAAPKSIRVAYKRNWTIQNEDALDTTISQSAKQSYSRAYIWSDIADNEAAILITPDSEDLRIDDGYFVTAIDANAVRDGIASRVGSQRDLFQIEIVAPLFMLTVGQIVRIYHDRFNLKEGKTGEILRIVEHADMAVLDVLVITK